MWSTAMALLSGIFLTITSVFGIREVEEPAYRTIDHVGAVEIREYGPRIAAETTVSGADQDARRAGFERIAGYIFGGNHDKTQIAMTAPVAQAQGTAPAQGMATGDGQRIAMTAPVDQARDAQGRWVIRFFMPARYTLQTLPAPNDPSVSLVTVPSETLAALRFSGTPSASAVAGEKTRLMAALAGSPWHPQGEPAAWFYDPPWTIPPLRRNEVAIPVAH